MDENPSQVGALGERLVLACRALERERREAPGLWQELLALPEDTRRGAAEAEPRFHTWGLCELLLSRSAALAETEPAEAGRLVELGLALAAHLDRRVHAEPVISDLSARLWAAAGEAARRTGDLRRAEEALAAAALCLAHGSGDLLLDAQLLEFEAAVRAEQGRTGEADALLKQAASRYGALHEDDLRARAMARRAQLRGALLDPARAVPSLAYETSLPRGR